jgi:hypothetical protein
MMLRLCRDKALANETILCLRVAGREFYAWVEGSPAMGYRLHVSRSLLGRWWQLDRMGAYSRASYRREPEESWAGSAPADDRDEPSP